MLFYNMTLFNNLFDSLLPHQKYKSMIMATPNSEYLNSRIYLANTPVLGTH
jgi:hypothetical protein